MPDDGTRSAAYASPLGRGWVLFKGDELVEIRLPDSEPPTSPVVEPPPPIRQVIVSLEEYFAGGRWPGTPQLAAVAGRTPFLHSVYATVAAIPVGKVAAAVGRPGAARAVGRAMATNPFPIVIPCHRVVASDGGLGGFAGGLEMKAQMLAMEGVDG